LPAQARSAKADATNDLTFATLRNFHDDTILHACVTFPAVVIAPRRFIIQLPIR
jgi:hypothetical protein